MGEYWTLPPLSPLAPNGLQIDVGASSKRRRQFVLNQFDDTVLGSTLACTCLRDDDLKKGERESRRQLCRRKWHQVVLNKSLRFMIVDDTIAIRKLIRRVSTKTGHTVDEADDR